MGDGIHILLVEDNPGDVRLTQEALRGARVANDLHVVGDGEEAIEYLRRRGRYVDAPRPDIILLDLNLPRLDGREVLIDIKSDPDLAKIPIIVLTSSSAERDIQSAYELHANCYISKPVDFTEFIEAVRSLEGFWLRIVRLPK
ncbi:response regulator [Mycobacterium sp. RTGN5]|uniref:response regulator n=1 Tax=Mycobacterium sp. RTGN5 TaxID=3016522 RepID=UPI0029C97DF8|nr:response regulator [Mycobacterium sp. RTGN5]